MLNQTFLTAIEYPDLPVTARREEIARLIQKHQVIVVAGETGSGKTTQLPKICLELGLAEAGLIGHTQPRRIAARAVASRIAEELHSELGHIVGYQVRFHDQVSESTQVKLMTDGILLAETQHDPWLKKYSVIIIDEAHERSLNIDFILGYLKRILPKRPDLKVIITSATIDLERFSQHFFNAPIIEVSGRTFPVDIRYQPLHELESEDDKEADLQAGILQAVDTLLQEGRRKLDGGPADILIFLPGEREIRETAETLRKSTLRDIEILPLYARLSMAEQNKVFNRPSRSGVRIVLASNVAETSLTVPGIGYVIDPGLARISRYSHRSRVQRLPVEAISQASANQRAGRCGRVAPGVCIRLYSEEDFNLRSAFTDAEILRTNLSAVILRMLQLKLGDVARFPFVDPPDTRLINDGFKSLQELGAVNAQKHLTALGREMAQLPVDPRIARMIVAAQQSQALRDVLIIASALSIQDPRERPVEKRQAADAAHKMWEDEQSDFSSYVNIWQALEQQREELSQNQLRKWCQKHFISWVRVREWRDLHRQLLLSCRQLRYDHHHPPASYAAIHQALLTGLLSHIGMKQENGEYLGARNRRFAIFPTSVLFKKKPKWVMAAEMLETSKLYAHSVAAIQPEWIEEPARHLIKSTYLEPHWEKKPAQVIAYQQITLLGLIIVPRRKVHYGAIDPLISHDIFIRHALVEGEYVTRAAFFHHNRQLLKQVETLEAKSRRRDLLIDEEELTQFYLRRFAELSGSHIVNGKGFERWRKKIEAENPKALFMQPEDILQRETTHISATAYPDQWMCEQQRLTLSYVFEPGTPQDGVTLHLPLSLLKVVDQQAVDWLVPGLLADKCIAIIKGLPKSQRKHYVPVPDYVERFCKQVTAGQGHLYEALARFLWRETGRKITAQELQAVELPAHFSMNIRLLDEQGKILAQEKNLAALQQQFAQMVEKKLQHSQPVLALERQGLTRWDFQDFPAIVAVGEQAGVHIPLYPALVDKGKSVDVKVLSQRHEAQALHVIGVARLISLAIPEKMRQVRKKMLNMQKSQLLGYPRMDKQRMEDQMGLAAILRAGELLETYQYAVNVPLNQTDYKALLDKVQCNLEREAQRLDAQVLALHQARHTLEKYLQGPVNLQVILALNDIKQQIQGLFQPDYLTQVPKVWLDQYPRYLHALEIRLEKLSRHPREQVLGSEKMQDLEKQYEQMLQRHQQKDSVDQAVLDLRWMLQELRVSLFAQQLGTRQKVSEKRIQALLQSGATD